MRKRDKYPLAFALRYAVQNSKVCEISKELSTGFQGNPVDMIGMGVNALNELLAQKDKFVSFASGLGLPSEKVEKIANSTLDGVGKLTEVAKEVSIVLDSSEFDFSLIGGTSRESLKLYFDVVSVGLQFIPGIGNIAGAVLMVLNRFIPWARKDSGVVGTDFNIDVDFSTDLVSNDFQAVGSTSWKNLGKLTVVGWLEIIRFLAFQTDGDILIADNYDNTEFSNGILFDGELVTNLNDALLRSGLPPANYNGRAFSFGSQPEKMERKNCRSWMSLKITRNLWNSQARRVPAEYVEIGKRFGRNDIGFFLSYIMAKNVFPETSTNYNDQLNEVLNYFVVEESLVSGGGSGSGSGSGFVDGVKTSGLLILLGISLGLYSIKR